ncbi:MAG: hypothetical protein AVDCRST_MAG65-1944, partial [uncultured Solirubrobacteraceae bacterium]
GPPGRLASRGPCRRLPHPRAGLLHHAPRARNLLAACVLGIEGRTGHGADVSIATRRVLYPPPDPCTRPAM